MVASDDVVLIRRRRRDEGDHAATAMSAVTLDPHLAASAERSTIFARVRAEVRESNRRLADGQIDLIADVAVELRLMQVRLGIRTDVTSS